MGMAASQARLLSITARLTDNENTGQNLSQSKMRLADRTQQINSDYMSALGATKLTVLTGFNGSSPSYTDISYSLMTGYDTVALGKQYVVTDTNGRVLVTRRQEEAFKRGNGDLNIFLADLGYSQADVNTKITHSNEADMTGAEKETAQKIHEAWDAYLTSVGKGFGDEEHDDGTNVTFGYTSFSNNAYDGYAVYSTFVYEKNADGTDKVDADGNKVVAKNADGTNKTITKPLNYEGTTKEQRQLYDYAVAITEAAMGTSKSLDLNTNNDSDNSGMITYLSNLFYRMAQSGFYSYSQDKAKDTINDNSWFEDQLRKGELLLEYYSNTEKGFVSTTYDEDSSIQEAEDTRQIALVEAKYTMDMSEVEQQDSRIDMELKKIDTEHSALQTEYDAVKGVIDKNVEKTFNIFS